MKKALYYLNLCWLYPVMGVAYMASPGVNKHRTFHGPEGYGGRFAGLGSRRRRNESTRKG